MFNMTFKGEIEFKVIGLCELRGYKWRKNGDKVSVIGVDQEIRDIIEEYADAFWGW